MVLCRLGHGSTLGFKRSQYFLRRLDVCFRLLDFGGEHGLSALPVRSELPEKMGFPIRWCLVGAEVRGERRRLPHGGGRKQLGGALAPPERLRKPCLSVDTILSYLIVRPFCYHRVTAPLKSQNRGFEKVGPGQTSCETCYETETQ